MNRNQLGILLVLVVVLGGAGLVITRHQQKAQSSGNSGIGKKLFKDFPMNDVTRMSVKHGSNEMNLVKENDLWRVRERNNYPANFSDIRSFLAQLHDLKAVQTEQVGASQLARLQLAGPGQGSNSAVVVEFKGQGDKPIGTLLLGKMHLNSRGGSPMMGEEGGGFPDGRYVKAGTESDSVALVSSPLENIEPKPELWLSKDFFRVESPSSIEVIFSVATNSWKLTRDSETADWKLTDSKAGEELDASKIAGVTNPFASPSFTDVMAGQKLEAGGTDQPTEIRIETFDHFQYAVKVGTRTNDNYLLTVSVTAKLEVERQPGNEEKPEDKARLDKEFKEKHQQLEAKLKQEQGYGNWTYLVSNWSIEPMMKERSGLMVEKKEEAKDGVSATSTEEPKVEDPPLPAIQPKP